MKMLNTEKCMYLTNLVINCFDQNLLFTSVNVCVIINLNR